MAMYECEAKPAYVIENNGGNGNSGDMFGGNGALFWIVVLFLFMFGRGGWGTGYGGGGSNQSGVSQADLQRGFDTQAIVSKLDGINNGICSSTYALSNAINSGFSSAELSRCNQAAAFMAQLNSMAMANQQCCCETQRLIERGFCDTNYNMATQASEIKSAIHESTRDIIGNQNDRARDILDFLTQDKISTLQSENNALRLAASQSNQNAVLMAAMDANKAEILRRTGSDCPVPAYVVPNPNCCYGNPVGVGYSNQGGYNSGCSGCGC